MSEAAAVRGRPREGRDGASADRHVLAARLRSARSELAQQQARSHKEEFDDKVTAYGDPAKAGEWRERMAGYQFRDRAAHVARDALTAAAALPSIRPVALSATARNGLSTRAKSARRQRRR
ncbi:hypothetical protein [Krasilnikovia sp. MM14-A1004]|uniref:hypothetical protein n=1 Tax=Krasilnikovia sp. MM14-A1004 TaxID=3373541 RepID=UPI00399D3C45